MLVLPSFPLGPGPLGARLRALGWERFDDAARWVHALPYGRNREKNDYRLVVEERHGTCSTKHALLAALAREHDQPVQLKVGLYEMTAVNAPATTAVLANAQLIAVPEAHCFLQYQTYRIDLTYPGTSGLLGLHFLEEHSLDPEEIGDRKTRLHHAFVAKWAAEHKLTFDQVWSVREACIEAMSVKK